MIRSPDNDKLKTVRKLAQKRWREKLGLFVAEGEDLVAAAERAGWAPRFVLHAGEDVEAELLHAVSSLGSGSRVVGVYEQRWAEPGGDLSVWLHSVEDPGNLGAIIRSAHALADGPVVLGPGCADPFSPKAVRATMGSLFARPPARSDFSRLSGTRVALDGSAAGTLAELTELEPPVVLCLGAEREGLPPDLAGRAEAAVRIPLRSDGPQSLNVAMAATVALYEAAHRMPPHG